MQDGSSPPKQNPIGGPGVGVVQALPQRPVSTQSNISATSQQTINPTFDWNHYEVPKPQVITVEQPTEQILGSGTAEEIIHNNPDTQAHIPYKRIWVSVGAGLVILLLIAAGSSFWNSRHNKSALNDSKLGSITDNNPSNTLQSSLNSADLKINRNTTISNGKKLSATGSVAIQNEANSAAAFTIQNAKGANVMVVDTVNNRVGIGGLPTGTAALQISGDLSINGNIISADGKVSLGNDGLRIGSVLVCTARGCISSSSPSPTPTSPTIDVANVAYLNKNQTFNGSVNTTSGFAVNGVTGANITCPAGEYLKDPVVTGGLTTGGVCNPGPGVAVATFQQVYDASNPSSLTLSSTNGLFRIQDALSPLATNLFEITSNGGASKYLSVNSSGVSVFGNSNITGQYQVNGAQISSSNLSNDSNLAKLDANQTFTGTNTYSGTLKTTFIQSQSSFPNDYAAGFKIAADAGNRFQVKTSGALEWGDGSGATDVNLYRSAGNILRTDNTFLIHPSVNSPSAFRVQNSSDSNVLLVDTSTNRVAINKLSASYDLDVNGSINGTTVYQNGNQVCDTGGNCSYSSSSLTDSANIARLDANQTFTGNNTFTGNLLAKNSTNSNSAFQVQNATGASLLSISTSSNQVIVQSPTNASDTFQVRDSVGSPIFGVDTLNRRVEVGGASGAATLAIRDGTGGGIDLLHVDSTVTGSDKTVFKIDQHGSTTFKNDTNTSTAFQIQNANGTSNLFIADTTNTRIAIGQASANYPLDVAGDINSTTGIRVGGTLLCASGGCLAASGSGSYIQNGTATQSNANFNIKNTNINSVAGVIEGANGQVADILDVQSHTGVTKYLAVNVNGISVGGDVSTTGQYKVNGTQISSANLSNDSNLAKLNAVQTFASDNTFTGLVLAKNTVDSATAFQVQNSSGGSLLTADSIGGSINIGKPNGSLFSDNFESNNLSNWDSNTAVVASTERSFAGSYAAKSVSSASMSYLTKNIAPTSTVYLSSEVNIDSAPGVLDLLVIKSASNTLTIYRDSSNSLCLYNGSTSCTAANIMPDDVWKKLELRVTGGLSGHMQIYINDSLVKDFATDTGAQLFNEIDLGNPVNGRTGTVFFDNVDARTAATLLTTLNANGNFNTLGNANFANATTIKNDLTNAFQIQNAAGSSNLLVADTINSKIGIGKIASIAGATLQVSGGIDITGQYSINGSQISSAALSNDSNLAKLDGTGPQTFTGNNKFTGTVLAQNSSNSTSAFQIQDTAGNALINANTTDSYVINNGTSSPGNELENPGFEATGSSGNGWDLTNGATILNDPSNAHRGNYVLQLPANGANSGAAISSKFYAVTSGNHYTLNAWIKTSAGTNGQAVLCLGYYNKDKTVLGATCSNLIDANTTYAQYEVTATFINSIYIKAAIIPQNNSTTGTWYIDDNYFVNGSIRAPLTLQNYTDSTTSFQVQNAAGTSVLINADTTNNRVGIGTAAPGAKLDILANTNIGLNVNQTGASNLLQLQNNGSGVVAVTNTGATTFKNSTDSTSAFKIQDSNFVTLLSADTSNDRIGIGTATPTSTLQVVGSGLITETVRGYSMWPSSTTPPLSSDPLPYELGVKFRADKAGYITGLKFYKGISNTGVHIGNLWTSTGTNLATVTFAGETASGWQQASFASPVLISANTTYIISYYAPVGHYGYSPNYFASSGRDFGNLHALANGVDGVNGVFKQASGGGFPNASFNNSNYWVDAIFDDSPTQLTLRESGSTNQDWLMHIANNGQFELIDGTGTSTTPFKVEANAPDNLLNLKSDGTLQIQNATGNSLLTADTVNQVVNLSGNTKIGNIAGWGDIQFSDGFESGNTSKWTNNPSDGATSVQSATAHSDKYAAYFSHGGSQLATTISGNNLYARAWVYVSSQTTPSVDLFYLDNGGNGNSWHVQRTTAGQLCINGANCSGSLSLNSWHEVELQVIIGAGTGSTNLWLDGSSLVALSSQSNGVSNIQSFGAGDSNGSDVMAMYMDDVVVSTARHTGSSALSVGDALNVQGSTSLNGQLTIHPAVEMNNIVSIQNWAGNNLLNIGTYNGNGSTTLGNQHVVVRTIGDTTSAFQVQNASGATLVNVDTQNTKVVLNTNVSVGTLYGSRLFTDDFESGGKNLWSNDPNTSNVQSAIVHNGKYSLRFNPTGGSSFVQTQLSGSTNAYMRAWVNISSQSSATISVMGLDNGGGNGYEWDVQRTLGGQVCIRNVATSSSNCGGSFTTGIWHLLELQISMVTTTTGVTNLWLDGSSIYSSSTENNGAPGAIGRAFAGDVNTDNAVGYIDDISIDSSVRNSTASSLGVDDSLHVSGNSTLGGQLLVMPASNTDNAFRIANQYGTTAFSVGTTNSGNIQNGITNINTTQTKVKAFNDTTGSFQVQNAAGGSLINVDSSNSNITLNGLQSGALGTWQIAGNATPQARSAHSSIVANGYIYVLGGSNSSAVYYSKLNANGSTNTWTTSSNPLPVAISYQSSVVYNNYIYIIGGVTAGGAQSTVYYAKLNADGSTSAWSTASNALPAVRYRHTSVVANGYVYVLGGENGSTPQSTVYYAKLNADGSVGAWTTSANALPQTNEDVSSSVANGYVYVVGGYNGGTLSTVYYAKLNADGSTNAWTAASNSLPVAMEDARTVVSNGYIYALAGDPTAGGSSTTSVYYSALNSSNGSVGVWQTNSTALPTFLGTPASAVIANGYIYLTGGNNLNAPVTYYASTSRVQIGANLDLVGLQGGTLADAGGIGNGSTGGSIIAGNITAVGSLQVQGGANFVQGASVVGAFNVSSSTGALLLAAEPTNMTITLGAPSATPVLLVLGNKNTASDPSCTSGALYYNSNSNQFRACQNGAWGSLALTPSYTSSLPGSPYDGQEVYYQADATNGVIWHLRYNAGSSSSYKWEYLGGASQTNRVEAQESCSTAAWTDLTTDGPKVTVSLAGEYLVEHSARMIIPPATAGNSLYAGINASEPIISWMSPGGTQNMVTHGQDSKVLTLTSGDVVKQRYACMNGQTVWFLNREVTVTPVRVN